MSRDSGGHFQQRLHLTWHRRPYWIATRTTWPRRPFSNTKPRDTTAAILNHAWPQRPSWISRDLGGHLGSCVTSAAILDLAWPRRPSWISRDLGGHLKSRVISAAILILTRLRQSRTNNLSKLLTKKKQLKCSQLWASQYRSCWCSVAIKRQSICSHSTVTITLSKVRATTANTLEYISHHNVCVICSWYVQFELFTRWLKMQLY